MHVYIVLLNNEIMSVCGDKQTAEWEKEMIVLDGGKEVVIKKCGVVAYDEDYHKRDLEMYKKIVPPRIPTVPGVSGTPLTK